MATHLVVYTTVFVVSLYHFDDFFYSFAAGHIFVMDRLWVVSSWNDTAGCDCWHVACFKGGNAKVVNMLCKISSGISSPRKSQKKLLYMQVDLSVFFTISLLSSLIFWLQCPLYFLCCCDMLMLKPDNTPFKCRAVCVLFMAFSIIKG